MILFWLMLYLPATYFYHFFCFKRICYVGSSWNKPKTFSRRSEPNQKRERVIKCCEAYPSLEICRGKQQRHLFSPAISYSFSLYISPSHPSSTPVFQHPNPFSYPPPTTLFKTPVAAMAMIIMTTTEVTSISLVDPHKCSSSSPSVHCHSQLEKMGSVEPLNTVHNGRLLFTSDRSSSFRFSEALSSSSIT